MSSVALTMCWVLAAHAFVVGSIYIAVYLHSGAPLALVGLSASNSPRPSPFGSASSCASAGRTAISAALRWRSSCSSISPSGCATAACASVTSSNSASRSSRRVSCFRPTHRPSCEQRCPATAITAATTRPERLTPSAQSVGDARPSGSMRGSTHIASSCATLGSPHRTASPIPSQASISEASKSARSSAWMLSRTLPTFMDARSKSGTAISGSGSIRYGMSRPIAPPLGSRRTTAPEPASTSSFESTTCSSPQATPRTTATRSRSTARS